MNKEQDYKDIAKMLGRKGGLKTKENLGKNHYRKMAKKSAEVRRKKSLSPDTLD
jgi:hypothetical protein